MAPTIASRDAEHEIATIRCLLAQQIHILERHAGDDPANLSADRLLRRLLDRDRHLRSRLFDAAAASMRACDPHDVRRA